MKREKTHSIKYNFIMNFILTSSQFIFPLITFPYVSRVLLSTGNGKVAFASSVANYFSMIASLGIPTYGIRACAQDKDDLDKLSKTVHELFILNAIMTTLVLITYFLSIIYVPRFTQDKQLFYINSVNILLNFLGMNWLFQALEKYDYITMRSIIFKVISIVLMFCFVNAEGDYVKYAAVTVFAVAGSNLMNLTQIHKYVKLKPYSRYNLRQHIKPILILFSQSLVVSIYTNLDTVMLGFMKESSDVGLYNAAIKLKGLLLSLVTSLGNVLLPRMSYYFKNKKMVDFKQLASKGINFTLFLSIPLCTYFIAYARESILFLAGEPYIGAVLAMKFVVFAVIANGLTGVLGVQVLTAEGKEKYVLYSVMAGAAIDFVLNLILIPKFGVSGAAFATAIAEYFVLAVQLVFTQKLVNEIRSDIRIVRFIVGSMISLIIALVFKVLNINSYFGTLVSSAVVFFGVYVLIQFIFKEPFINSLLNSVIQMVKKGTRNNEGN